MGPLGSEARVLAEGASSLGHSAACLPEKGAPFFAAVSPSNGLPPLLPRATLDIKHYDSIATVDPTPPLRREPPLLLSTARAERNGQEHFATRDIATHTNPTPPSQLRMRLRADPRLGLGVIPEQRP
jgi:hypothetical protein